MEPPRGTVHRDLEKHSKEVIRVRYECSESPCTPTYKLWEAAVHPLPCQVVPPDAAQPCVVVRMVRVPVPRAC